MPSITYPLDLTGLNPANLVTNEPQTPGGLNGMAFVLTDGPFFTEGLIIVTQSGNTLLRPNVDYKAIQYIADASRAAGKQVCAVILIVNSAYTGVPLHCTYQTIGGQYQAYNSTIQALINSLVLDGRQVQWGNILNKPNQFPPPDHDQDVSSLYGMDELIAELEGIRQAILLGSQDVDAMLIAYVDTAIENRTATDIDLNNAIASFSTGLTNHIAAAFGGPLAHTAAQVGLGNVNNTSDANKPVSTAQQAALDGKVSTTYNVSTSGLLTGGATLTGGSISLSVAAATNPETIAGAITNKAVTPAGLAALVATFIPGTFGLGNVDNTSDVNKPVSTAQATAIATKVDKTITVTGGGLASGGGALSSNQVITVTKSTTLQAQAGTDDATVMTPAKTADAIAALSPAAALPAGGYGTRIIKTGNQTLIFTAADLILGASLGGDSVRVTGAYASIDTSTVGADPSTHLGGMDVGSAPTNSYLYLFAMYGADGLTLVATTSASMPVGPNRCYIGGHAPIGYNTHSCFVGIWPTDGSGYFSEGFIVERTMSFPEVLMYTSNTNLGSWTSVSNPPGIPPNGVISISGMCDAEGTAGGTSITLVAADNLGTGKTGYVGSNFGGSGAFNLALRYNYPAEFFVMGQGPGTPTLRVLLSSYTFY